MTPEAHRRKAERITRSLALLRATDYEIRIDGAMLAANHYVNLALHVLGLRPVDNDIVHSEYLPAIDLIRFRVLAPGLLDALEQLEDLRAPFVRGGAPGGEAAGELALRLLVQARGQALALRPHGLPIANYDAALRRD